MKRPNLAARRGKSLLAINLGSGTYFVPTATSPIRTPTETPSRRGSLQPGSDSLSGGSSTQFLLPYSDLSPSSASSSAQAGSSRPVTPYSPFGPNSPASEKLADFSQARRKGSVTFADGIASLSTSPLRSPAVHTPTLEVVPPSPQLPEISIHDVLSTNWSEAVRTLAKEEEQPSQKP